MSLLCYKKLMFRSRLLFVKHKNQGRRKLALFHSKTSSVSFHTYFFMTEYIKFDEFSYKLKGL